MKFSEAYHARIEDVIERGREVGISPTRLCKEAKIARATIDRIRENVPLSIQIVDRLEEVVIKAEAAKGAPDNQ